MPRPPRPEDLYRLRIATEPRLSPDGRLAAITVQVVAPGFDGYRHALWLVPTDGSAAPRQVTLGARNDTHARFSPDGRTLAFLSDRRPLLEEEPDRPSDAKEREDASQVHLLPLDGGEARRLTDLPRGVSEFEWSPDATRLVVVSASVGATYVDDVRRRGLRRRSREAGSPPPSDYRFIDRLAYMLNGEGFTYDQVTHLWLVDVETGAATRLTDGPVADSEPAWSPDGTRIAFSANRRRDPDLTFRQAVHVVDVATHAVTAVTGGPRSIFGVPAWMPDGQRIAALGSRLTGGGGSRNDVWLFSADGSEARQDGGRDLTGRHDLMPGSDMIGDVTVGETSSLWTAPDGRSVVFTAPVDGGYQLWRVSTTDGDVERLTEGRHYISSWHAVAGPRGRPRIAYLRSSPTEPPDLWVQDGGGSPRRLTALNADVLAELELRTPLERRVRVDGHDVQGWFLPPAGAPPDGTGGPWPTVTQIHGGPHTLYGWAPMWEFQVLAGAGVGVYYCNPRGSEGYGQAFNDGNHRDWGPGPMRDVIAGVEALVGDGLADPARLGLTGGSYGGYLTNWIIAHDDRFAAAMTCRSVSDMGMLFLTGDISGGDWAILEFDVTPWDDPAYYREISPITYANGIRTPLLIQHAEQDLRTTVAQAEALFTVLRSLRRPVRLLRVPEETHELTRSGTPFRRVENLRIVLDWFSHFLLDGRRGLPPLPKVRGGR
jgi:dipeptidyl aminopeptidase/acylaminoacyl peptidase